MYHNITFKVMYFAGDKPEWRVYTDSGQYHTCKTVEDIPNAIKGLLRGSAKQTLDLVGKDSD